MTKLSTGAQALIALAVANVLFVNKWGDIASAIGPYGSYFRTGFVSLSFLASFFGTLLAVVAILFVALSVSARWNWLSERNAYRIAGVLIATQLLALLPVMRHSRMKILVSALVLSVCALLWTRSAAAGRMLVMAAAALFFVQSVSFAWDYARSPTAAELRDRSSIASSGPIAAKLIVWLLFDELDYELAVDLRPSTVQMPEFDRLARGALVATDAHGPADRTTRAVPSFFIGDRVTEAYPGGPGTLHLKIRDSRNAVPWETRDTLFAQARRHGLRSAIVGWFHPYCRLFGAAVETCFWVPAPDATDSLRGDFVVRQTGPKPVLPGWPLMPLRLQHAIVAAEFATVAPKHVELHREMQFRAVEALRNTNINFVFVHWLIPHPPGIYDRRSKQLGAGPGLTYLDNLELVDATIGKIRRTLEQAGAWDQTALIVTSDHPLRPALWRERTSWTREEDKLCAARKDPRVPLLIKVPGQKTSATYSASIDAVLIHDLISAWMAGQCGTVDEVRSLFDQRRGRFPVHADSVSSARVP